jgi:hypothetical protein
MRGRIAAASIVVLLIASIAGAQFRRFQGGYSDRPMRYATLEDFDGSFQFCRVVFRQSSNGDGGNWSVDFPRADQNLSVRLSELTKTPVSRDENDSESVGLRDYLLKGGFLWADDFWGDYAWDIFESQMRKVLPSATYPFVDLPIEHAIFHGLMPLASLPQIPSIGYWGGPGGPTSERGRLSATPHARAIVDEHGRVMVLATHNTDIGDSFEREGDSREYFLQFSVHGYALGINILLYAMTH